MALLFLLATYGPLQVAAIMLQKGPSRIAAAMPLLVMVPMIIATSLPSASADGSLFGMYFVVPYLPVMLYLLVALLNIPKTCSQCGSPIYRRSFQATPEKCARCMEATTQPSLP